MEKLLTFLSEENSFFDPQDALSRLIEETMKKAVANADELEEDELNQVRAARSAGLTDPEISRKAGQNIWKKI